MAKVRGIGGVFIHAKDPEALARWYTEQLGITFSSEGTPGIFYIAFYHRDLNDPSKTRNVTFAIMPAKKDLGATRGQYTINYVVDDLEALTVALRTAGISVEEVQKQQDDEGYGLFTHLKDPEGNRIELYQPLR